MARDACPGCGAQGRPAAPALGQAGALSGAPVMARVGVSKGGVNLRPKKICALRKHLLCGLGKEPSWAIHHPFTSYFGRHFLADPLGYFIRGQRFGFQLGNSAPETQSQRWRSTQFVGSGRRFGQIGRGSGSYVLASQVSALGRRRGK